MGGGGRFGKGSGLLPVKRDQRLCLPLKATTDFLFLSHPVKLAHWGTGKAATKSHAFLPRDGEGMMKRRQEPRGEGTHPGGRQTPRESAKVGLCSSDTCLPAPADRGVSKGAGEKAAGGAGAFPLRFLQDPYFMDSSSNWPNYFKSKDCKKNF